MIYAAWVREVKKNTSTCRPNDDVIILDWKYKYNTTNKEVELTIASQRENEAKNLANNAIVIDNDGEDSINKMRVGDGEKKMLCPRHGKSTDNELGDENNRCRAGGEVDMKVEMDSVRGSSEPLNTEMEHEVDRNVDKEVRKEVRGCGDECIGDKNDDKENVLADLEKRNVDLRCDENREESRRQKQVSMSSRKAYDRARQALLAKERYASR